MSSLAISAALLLAGQSLVLEAGVRQETRAGVSPSIVTQTVVEGGPDPRQPVIELELAPSVAAILGTSLTQASLRYVARLFERFISNESGLIISHQVVGSFAHRFGPQTQLRLDATAGIGQIDYGATGTVFQGPESPEQGTPNPAQTSGRPPGAPPPSIPTGLVIGFKSLAVDTALTTGVSRGLELELGARGEYTGPLDRSSTTAGSNFPEQRRGLAQGELHYSPNAREQLQLGVFAEIDSFATGGQRTTFEMISSRIGWRHRFSRRTEGTAGAGAGILISENGNRALPRADLSVTTNSGRSRSVVWNAGLGLALTTFSDQFAGTVGTQIASTLDFGLVFPDDDLRATLDASFTTPADFSAPPANLPPGTLETLAMVRVPVTWQISQLFALEVGGRVIARAPRLGAEAFRFQQLELLGYVALVAVLRTGRDEREQQRSAAEATGETAAPTSGTTPPAQPSPPAAPAAPEPATPPP